MRLKEVIPVVAFLTLSVIQVRGASVYPTTYPFEKETIVPEALPDTNPNETAALADKSYAVGGYIRRLEFCDPYSADRVGISYLPARVLPNGPGGWHAGFTECRPMVYNFIKQNIKQTVATRNCTSYTYAKTFDMKTAEMSGKIGPTTVCEGPGKCCPQLDGFKVPFAQWNENSKQLDTVATTSGCGTMDKTFAYSLYCYYSFFPHSCTEYFAGQKASNARSIMGPCRDVLYRYYAGCKLLTLSSIAASALGIENDEPEAYIKTLTAGQVLTIGALFKFPDRVCHPYSYYLPSAAKNDGDNQKTPSTPSFAHGFSGTIVTVSGAVLQLLL